MDVWNDAFRDFFSCLGLRVVHRKALGSNGKRRIGTVGKKMLEAVKEAHLPPISGFFGPNRQVFTALDYTPALNSSSGVIVARNNNNKYTPIFPQIQLLDELHEESPSSTFLLPMPAIQDWIDWAQHFHNFTERWARMEIPGLVLTEEQRAARKHPCPEIDDQSDEQRKQQQSDVDGDGIDDSATSERENRRCIRLSDDQLKDWWCGHVRHIRGFVETHRHSHTLVELDLSPENQRWTALHLEELFGANQTCISMLFPAPDESDDR